MQMLKVALALLFGAVVGCAPPAIAPPVLLITVDTLRADRVGAYGYSRNTSPWIDALAAGGAIFETAYAPMGTTCPSHATLFTSRSPEAHRVVRNGLHLAQGERTLAEILQDAGYQTAAFVSSFPVARGLGFAQGFDHFDDQFEASEFAIPLDRWEGHSVGGVFDRPGAATADRALAWLAGRADTAPLFVWVHLFDPHYPYRPPPSDAARFVRVSDDTEAVERDLYDAEVYAADREVGRLVAAMEAHASAPPLVVVTSDHGEGLFDHGWRSHNRTLFEEEVRVPLVIHWAGNIQPGTRVSQPAHLIDVAPTILAALGLLEAGPAMDGLDLLPFIRGEQLPDSARPLWLVRPQFAEGRAPRGREGAAFGVRVGQWKYIEASKPRTRQLYDLASDPTETRNLADAQRQRSDELSGLIAQWQTAERAKVLAGPVEGPSDEERRALRALGYTED
jgi:choline-sulfatase